MRQTCGVPVYPYDRIPRLANICFLVSDGVVYGVRNDVKHHLCFNFLLDSIEKCDVTSRIAIFVQL